MSDIPKEIKPRKRRTNFMIDEENKQILEYIKGGATDRQIREWLGLSERHYRSRINKIERADLKHTIELQTPESHAFLLARIQEKISNLQLTASQIAVSRTEDTKDKLQAMEFLRQLYQDEYSLFMYGPSKFLTSIGPGIHGRGRESAIVLRQAIGEPTAEEVKTEQQQDDNAVF